MSKRVLILVEGQTEERFVKDILSPAFFDLDLYFHVTLLVTKRVKSGPNFKGGITTFGKFEKDANRLLNSAGDALVTTLLDYYGLPNDFPGMRDRSQEPTPLRRVKHVERAIHHHFGAPSNFLPFLALHEFEAWLYCSASELPRILTEQSRQQRFAKICNSVASPEEINENPNAAPSKRIKDLFPAYRKVIHGPLTVAKIGLEVIREQCPHFAEWLTNLEDFANS
ncbi:MAG: DUF4276 family protein [Candidatus Hydrogenedentes bacterium]|nr:DUF4276 family protein [Candidatus Hydrogenedentota bacterium]